MPSTLPDGDAAPRDGRLPASALTAAAGSRLGFYVHVPFCRVRCGYCDFNTYTATELRGVSQADYAATAVAELKLAASQIAGLAPVTTVFFGGGTPTLLPPSDLAVMLRTIDDELGLAPGAEVTVEANPETVDPEGLALLRAAGVNRLSIGMQSAAPHVLTALDRQHRLGRPEQVARWARDAGFDHVSLDLIYGAPGESDADWQSSLDAAAGAGVDHVSAYSLIVEAGTKLHRQVSRGEVQVADEDTLARRYQQADATLAAAGLHWYEVSNWAMDRASRCTHNELYWNSESWWGIGPGAHSHIGGIRWWNVKHPAAYTQRLQDGASPAAAREVLTPAQSRLEDVMLRLRCAEGLPVTALSGAGVAAAHRAAASGLLRPEALAQGRAVLTDPGRLLADAVVRDLTD